MGIVNRSKNPRKPNYQLNYSVTEELRVQHGLAKRSVREPGGSDKRAALAVLAQRKREVRDGTWLPAELGSSGLLVETYAERWIADRRKAGVATVRDEEQRLRDYVLPVVGRRPLREVSRTEVKRLMAAVAAEPSKHTGKPHAPRTVHRIYEALRTMYSTAVLDEVVLASPCTLRIKRGELPPKQDADPRWRSGAVYTRDEIESLISDPRVPHQRRMYYGIAFLASTRLGEVSGRRWRDYDPVCELLGRLLCATQYDDLPLKGQRPAREVPVHPTLARMLAEWKLAWPSIYGRHPTPDDFIVPKRAIGKGTLGITAGAITQQRAWDALQDDLRVLGLRPRRMHDTRRTFISLAKADGADAYLLRFITHGPPKNSAFDDYVTPPWPALCEQVAKLKVSLRGHASVAQIVAHQRSERPKGQ